MPSPGSRPGSSGGIVTSGWVLGRTGGEVVSALPFGGSSRPPVLPPSRPSSDALELAERLGLPLPSPVWPCGRRAAAGARRGGAVAAGGAGRRGARARAGPRAAAPGRGLREQGLQRRDFLVYGVEHRRHLLTDVPELHRQPVAQLAPRLAVGLRERRQGLDGDQGPGVALVGLVQQAVALGGVVLHAEQGAADLAHGVVVEVAAAATLQGRRASFSRVDARSRYAWPRSLSPSAR